jgi:hypothetical protein
LSTTIDPPGQAEIQLECDTINPPTAPDTGLGMTKAAFLALNPQVVGFDTPTGSAQGQPQTLVVTYAAGKTITFGFAAAYNWGGYTSGNRKAFSGPNLFSDISTVETQPDNCWFSVPSIAVSSGQGVKAIAFCAHGRDDGTPPPPEPPSGPDDKESGPGDAIFTLSDGSTQSVHYPMFGGNGIATQAIFIGYQAPANLTITSFRCTRPGSGNSYIAVDDLAFVLTAPTTLVGDINNDGTVGVADLQALIQAWATATTGAADINGNGLVNVGDLQLLVQHWGDHN